MNDLLIKYDIRDIEMPHENKLNLEFYENVFHETLEEIIVQIRRKVSILGIFNQKHKLNMQKI